MAAQSERPVHKIDILELQEKLRERGQILSLKENIYGAFGYTDEIIIDNNMKRFTLKTDEWKGIETEPNGRYQMNFSENDEGKGRFSFKPWLPQPGLYELSIWYPSKKTCSAAVPILINHKNGPTQMILNQKKNGGQWMVLGRYELESGYQEVVTVIAEGVEGIAVADAIKLKLIR